jgi:hypothetical protein
MKIIFTLFTLIFFSGLYASDKKGSYRIEAAGIDSKYFEEQIGPLSYFEPKPDKDGIITHENEGAPVSWEVYVPENYDPAKPAGILSYINAGDGGKVPGKWRSLMDKHNLIWIGANKSGNFVSGSKKKPYYNYWRHVLSIKGVQMIKEAYNIDEDRVFLSGMSGGGRVSSLLITSRPDIYKGAIYNCGCNRWYNELSPKVVKEASKNYYVLLSGTKDFNLPGTKSLYTYYQDNGFKNSKLVVVDGLGHKTPDTDDYDKALKYLDTPKKLRLEEAVTNAYKAEKSKKYSDAMQLFGKAAGYGSQEAQEKLDAYKMEIDSMYKTARDAEKIRDFVLCLNTFDAIYKKFGMEIGKEAYDQSKALKKEKQIVLEIKAMAYFLKIEKAIKGGNTNDKVKAALEKVIKTCPESFAARRAKEELDKIAG